MNHVFLTKKGALARGFVQVPGQSNLFTHPDIEGLLFKTVTSKKSALALGGFLTLDDSVSTTLRGSFLIGRSARYAYDRGLIGRVALPKTVVATPASDARVCLSGAALSSGSNYLGKFYRPAYLTLTQLQWYKPYAKGQVMAIVSKAFDGHGANFVDEFGSTTTPNVIANVLTVSVADGWTAHGAKTYANAIGQQKLADGVYSYGPGIAGWAGYVDQEVGVNILAALTSAKSAYLATVNPDAVDAFAEAYELELKNWASSASLARYSRRVRVFMEAGKLYSDLRNDGNARARSGPVSSVLHFEGYDLTQGFDVTQASSYGTGNYETNTWKGAKAIPTLGIPLYTSPVDRCPTGSLLSVAAEIRANQPWVAATDRVAGMIEPGAGAPVSAFKLFGGALPAFRPSAGATGNVRVNGSAERGLTRLSIVADSTPWNPVDVLQAELNTVEEGMGGSPEQMIARAKLAYSIASVQGQSVDAAASVSTMFDAAVVCRVLGDEIVPEAPQGPAGTPITFNPVDSTKFIV